MKHDLLALRGLLVTAVAFVVVMSLTALAISQGTTQILVPSPETVAYQFAGSLAAHRYEGAMNQLGEDLREQVSEGELASLVRALESRGKGIKDASGEGQQVEGDSASARLRLRLSDGTEQTVEFTLRRENGLWKLADLDPMKALGGSVEGS